MIIYDDFIKKTVVLKNFLYKFLSFLDNYGMILTSDLLSNPMSHAQQIRLQKAIFELIYKGGSEFIKGKLLNMRH